MAEISLVDWLIRLLIVIFFGVPSQPAPPPAVEPALPTPTVEDQMQQIPSVVETVETLMLESYPVQIELVVVGYHPDGCDAPLVVDQQRDGNHVSVRLYRQLPGDVMCPAIIVPFEESVRLEGGFETGTYTIDVNGVTVEVTI